MLLDVDAMVRMAQDKFNVTLSLKLSQNYVDDLNVYIEIEILQPISTPIIVITYYRRSRCLSM